MTDLRELLTDAVDDVEPTDRLHVIRQRAAAGRSARRRSWVAAGAAVAAAAAVAAVVVRPGGSDHPAAPSDHPTGFRPPPHTVLVPAYYLGDTPRGPRLFRELDEVDGDDPVAAALQRLQRPPLDPDYRTGWPQGSFENAGVSGGVIHVGLGSAAPDPAEVDALAWQQLVYTLDETVGRALPVRLTRDGRPVGTPVAAAPQTQVLAHVSISEPTEGTAYHGVLTARGRAASAEGTVRWELRDDAGRVVRRGATTVVGAGGDRLRPWRLRAGLRGVPYGFYTLVAVTEDLSGGLEGPGPDSDTRTIIVR